VGEKGTLIKKRINGDLKVLIIVSELKCERLTQAYF
jgi:hypothetical protein